MSFVDSIIIFPLCILGTLVHDQLTMYVWIDSVDLPFYVHLIAQAKDTRSHL